MVEALRGQSTGEGWRGRGLSVGLRCPHVMMGHSVDSSHLISSHLFPFHPAPSRSIPSQSTPSNPITPQSAQPHSTPPHLTHPAPSHPIPSRPHPIILRFAHIQRSIPTPYHPATRELTAHFAATRHLPDMEALSSECLVIVSLDPVALTHGRAHHPPCPGGEGCRRYEASSRTNSFWPRLTDRDSPQRSLI